MAEFKFVAKCLLITAVIMFALQFDIQGQRAETYVSNYIRHGTAIVWVRDSMKGAHLFIAKNSAELAPKLKMGDWWPMSDEKKDRNVSSDIPEAEYPEEDVGDGAAQKASVF